MEEEDGEIQNEEIKSLNIKNRRQSSCLENVVHMLEDDEICWNKEITEESWDPDDTDDIENT